MVDSITHSFFNFVNGLKKSFSGKDYLRDINQCNKCGKPSFTDTCLYCHTEQDYKDKENEVYFMRDDHNRGFIL